MPFGEVFIEERNNKWNTPYLFNAKELDEETGLYYYGARYYDPRTSTWLSVDPLAEKYPSISPYAYCNNNPIRYIDPTGMAYGDFLDEKGNVIGNDDINDERLYVMKTDATASIELPVGKSTFHSHPSGTIEDRSTPTGNVLGGGTTTTYSFTQTPSLQDISNAGSFTNYVFGRRDNKVYIYNSSGTQASIPLNRFVTPKRK